MKASALLLGAMLLGLVACTDRDGPAENLGERLDNAAEEAGERLENAGDEIEEAAEEIGDSLRDN
jgi:hypothetical protein